MKKKDILGREPQIGDIIAYNPPRKKGMDYGKVIGYSVTGLPVVDKPVGWGHSSPRTGFAIIKSESWL